jgi:hypothetical protein
MVSGDHDLRIKSRDLVQIVDPVLTRLGVSLRGHQVNLVIDNVASDHGCDRRDVHDRRVCGVALTDVDDLQL